MQVIIPFGTFIKKYPKKGTYLVQIFDNFRSMKHKFVAKPDGSLSLVRKVGLAGWAKKLQYLRCFKF